MGDTGAMSPQSPVPSCAVCVLFGSGRLTGSHTHPLVGCRLLPAGENRPGGGRTARAKARRPLCDAALRQRGECNRGTGLCPQPVPERGSPGCRRGHSRHGRERRCVSDAGKSGRLGEAVKEPFGPARKGPAGFSALPCAPATGAGSRSRAASGSPAMRSPVRATAGWQCDTTAVLRIPTAIRGRRWRNAGAAGGPLLSQPLRSRTTAALSRLRRRTDRPREPGRLRGEVARGR